MERSTLRLPDRAPEPRQLERRRTVRQKLHSPVYVSFNGPQSGMVLDLSELLDLHENGFGVQTAIPAASKGNDRLEVNRAISLCLDLPETRKYVHGSGQVMWIDDGGRAGIRFSFLPEGARHILKEWLFANLLIASNNYTARQLQLAGRQQEESSPIELSPVESPTARPAPLPPAVVPSMRSTALPDRAELLSSLDDLRREVREIEAHKNTNTSDTVLYLIAERAMNLTGATGAALALLTGDRMLCRARVGDPAPRLGSEVDAKTGLSGECIRAGLLVTCEDPENDPRVDPEICRRLGIGSFMAAPILNPVRVVGLLEIFSPSPRSFSQDQGAILQRLVELVPQTEGPEQNNEGNGRELRETAPETTHPKNPEPRTTAPGKLEQDKIEQKEIEQEKIEQEKIERKKTAPLRTVTTIEPSNPPASRSEADESRIKEIQIRKTEIRQTQAVEKQPESDADAIRALAQRMRLQQHVLFEEDVAQEDLARHEMPQDLEDRPAPARRSYLVHLLLLALAVAVVALVLGYLLAPVIQRRWNPEQSLQNAQSSSRNTSAVSPSSQLRAPRALSPAELRQLADQGNADAQWELGILYHDGAGVSQDDKEAVKWFQRAADQGYVLAQGTLGAYYWAGRGVPQDFSKAYFWSQLALAQGDEDSKLRLEGLAAQMTPGQVARARQEAEAWLHNFSQSKKPNPQSNQ